MKLYVGDCRLRPNTGVSASFLYFSGLAPKCQRAMQDSGEGGAGRCNRSSGGVDNNTNNGKLN
ncbi:hypothetical protein OUZ56_012563 [Daphnia magna]|uniref:Uncharacterized protein n=1 Tax=Daphnia magna TaxID=35525 RepID=A0ABQ9Z3G7_9CRUS|nr:hypothetical protein OUZ56_012563 [Daphnia magna]